MKLSIITINRNNASGLLRTIESVVSQTWKDFEYIVIDGASSDESVDVIKRYESSITTWLSEADTGIYNAMNKGIRRASGEYCLFLNSGDFLVDEQALERVFSHDFSADIALFSLINTDREKSYCRRPPSKITLYTFLQGDLSHPSSFIRRSLFLSIGYYNEKYRIISDWCFFVDALILHNVSYARFDDVVSVFDRSGVSISTNGGDIISEEKRDYLIRRFPRVWEDYNIPEYCSNSIFYLCKDAPIVLRFLFLFPLRILNRLLKLRNRLGRKLSVEKIYYNFFDKEIKL